MPIYFHVRANYITKLWRLSLQNKILVSMFTVGIQKVLLKGSIDNMIDNMIDIFPDNMADICFDLLLDEDGCESGIKNDESHDDW